VLADDAAPDAGLDGGAELAAAPGGSGDWLACLPVVPRAEAVDGPAARGAEDAAAHPLARAAEASTTSAVLAINTICFITLTLTRLAAARLRVFP
jgi:hypothetical protein